MKGLDTRIAKLEKAAGMQDDGLVVIIRSFDGDLLYGYRWGREIDGTKPVDTIRQAGEADADLLDRARLSANPLTGLAVLRELRR